MQNSEPVSILAGRSTSLPPDCNTAATPRHLSGERRTDGRRPALLAWKKPRARSGRWRSSITIQCNPQASVFAVVLGEPRQLLGTIRRYNRSRSDFLSLRGHAYCHHLTIPTQALYSGGVRQYALKMCACEEHRRALGAPWLIGGIATKLRAVGRCYRTPAMRLY